MFKTALILAVGFAAASANFLEEDRLLQVSTTTNTDKFCVFSTTTEPCSAGYCCATVKKDGALTITDTKNGVCVASEIDGTSISVGTTKYDFTCKIAATATNYKNTLGTCLDSKSCSSNQCCSTRTATF